jgi:hypothetical protein
MGLIKKTDVEKYFAARRSMRQGRIGPVRQPDATRIEPNGTQANSPHPVGNPTLVHPSASASSASIPITSDSGRNRLLRPPGSWQE